MHKILYQSQVSIESNLFVINGNVQGHRMSRCFTTVAKEKLFLHICLSHYFHHSVLD